MGAPGGGGRYRLGNEQEQETVAFPTPLRFHVFEYVRRMNSGATGPLLCTARIADGSSRHIVLKLRNPGTRVGHFGPTSLAVELAMATIGRFLGLDVPEYGLAEVDGSFASSVSDEAVRLLLVQNRGLNFATAVVVGSVIWNPRHKAVSAELESAIDSVMSFDAAVINGDRKETNPNLLWDGADVVRVIDHGLACPVHQWDDGTIAASPLFPDSEIQAHSGFRYLEGKGRPFSSLHSAWHHALTDAEWEELRGMIPPEWEHRPGDLERVFRFLRARASRLAEVTASLRRLAQ